MPSCTKTYTQLIFYDTNLLVAGVTDLTLAGLMSRADGVSFVCISGRVLVRDGAGVCIDSETMITSSSSSLSSLSEGSDVLYKHIMVEWFSYTNY